MYRDAAVIAMFVTLGSVQFLSCKKAVTGSAAEKPEAPGDSAADPAVQPPDIEQCVPHPNGHMPSYTSEESRLQCKYYIAQSNQNPFDKLNSCHVQVCLMTVAEEIRKCASTYETIVTTEFAIVQNGDMIESEIINGETYEPYMTDCILSLLRTVKFPKQNAAPKTIIQYPFKVGPQQHR